MTLTIYEATVPVLSHALTNMAAWLDKALAEGKDEAALVEARLAPDMQPLSAQYQMASDSAKSAVAKLTGNHAPAMPDTETTFAELKDRCQRTLAYIEGVERSEFNGAEDRPIELRFPNGMGYRFVGREYLTNFVLPNFLFHATTAYALMRASGVELGKADYLRHLGSPIQLAPS